MTGGRLTQGTNDLSLAYARAQRDLGCRYTLGFYDRKPEYDRSHQVSVNVRRPGLRAIHPVAYEFLSPKRKYQSLIQAAFLAPTAFEGGILRAKLFPIRPLTPKSWQALVVIEFPVQVDPRPSSTTVREFGAILRKGPDIVHSITRKVSVKARGSGSPSTRVLSYLEPATLDPGDYTLTVVMSEIGGKSLSTARVAASIPPIPKREIFLVGPLLGRRGAGGLVIKGSGQAMPEAGNGALAGSAARDPAGHTAPGPAAGDRIGSDRSFQPLLIYEVDRRAPLIARTEACVVLPRRELSSRAFVRSLTREGGMTVGGLAPATLAFGGRDKVQCRSFLDEIPLTTLPSGDYTFDAMLDPPLGGQLEPARIQFLVTDDGQPRLESLDEE